MKPISIREFAKLCGGKVLHADGSELIRGFSWDSREIDPGDLFLAIRGEHHDGHDFVPEVINRGAVAGIVERPVEAPSILVESLVESLARYGAHQRGLFNGPVLGVTGSNGKTSAKEFVAAALSPLGRVLKNEGNHNTEYSAPLVWASLEPDTRVVVAEMGMRGFGQISQLCSFIRPTMGLITMIGTAHIEKVGSREGIAKAKAELIEALPIDAPVILWAEDDFFGYLKDVAGDRPVHTFGWTDDAECKLLGYKALSWTQSVIMGRLGGQTFEIKLPAVGRHQAQNAAAAMMVAHLLNVSVDQAAGAIELAILPPMRLEEIQIHGVTVLLDSYNASPDSTVAALKTLVELPSSGRKVAILGEMRELGEFTESGHRQVGRALAASMIDHAVLFGTFTRWIREDAEKAGFPTQAMDSVDSLVSIQKYLEQLAPGDVCLIKGSRVLGMERLVLAEGAKH